MLFEVYNLIVAQGAQYPVDVRYSQAEVSSDLDLR
jgi:hypothetical protein